MTRPRRRLALCSAARFSRGLVLALVLAAGSAQADELFVEPGTAERITFADAVKRALAHNPTARVADEEIRRAHALMEQARAASLPTIVGNGTYTRLDHD